MTSRTRASAGRRADTITRSIAADLRQLREDCGISQRSLANAAGIAQSVISRLEANLETPSVETYARLAAALGADLSMRIYPNTGPALRDRHQARIVEGLIRALGARWTPLLEVAVHRPVRGWIDSVLIDVEARLAIATEVESAPRRLEQFLRWSEAKAAALPSASAFPFGLSDPTIDRLLVLRDTRANRALAAEFGRVLATAYPADPWQARAALTGRSEWPGASMLWAIDRRDGGVEISASPRNHSGVGGHSAGGRHSTGGRHSAGGRT